MSENNCEGFSIVLCTHNGEFRLTSTLMHLAALSVPEGNSVELIVVNNASTDNTKILVQTVWVNFGQPFPLRIIDEKKPGKGYAIEVGYDSALFPNILTVDDDNWLHPDYLINASEIFKDNPNIGVLQGRCEAVYESEPPAWVKQFEIYFVIGSPVKEPGFFSETNYHVWGAGMVIKKSDWIYLRNKGFSFLTSKVPGKAAGEDNETAMALVMLGKKIYFSDQLNYRHFMPADRIAWSKLSNNFEVYGYVRYYFFLYALVVDAYKFNYTLTRFKINTLFMRAWFTGLNRFSFKQLISYKFSSKKDLAQLQITYFFSLFKTYKELNENVMKDVKFLQSWMHPILKMNSKNFSWPSSF